MVELPASDAASVAEQRALLALTVGLMGLVADMLAHGLVDHSFFLVDLSYVFFLALAAIQHIGQIVSWPKVMSENAFSTANEYS